MFVWEINFQKHSVFNLKNCNPIAFQWKENAFIVEKWHSVPHWDRKKSIEKEKALSWELLRRGQLSEGFKRRCFFDLLDHTQLCPRAMSTLASISTLAFLNDSPTHWHYIKRQGSCTEWLCPLAPSQSDLGRDTTTGFTWRRPHCSTVSWS